jgi:hypothetical protein
MNEFNQRRAGSPPMSIAVDIATERRLATVTAGKGRISRELAARITP